MPLVTKVPRLVLAYVFSLVVDLVRNERLDTVEEVSEPASSSSFLADSLPQDLAARMSSGTASSDFQMESLPPDQQPPSTNQSKPIECTD